VFPGEEGRRGESNSPSLPGKRGRKKGRKKGRKEGRKEERKEESVP